MEKKLSICLACDFFYPRVGGVEVHIYQLAVSLIRLGCKVIVLTHSHNNRQGVRYMGNGIKVYYLPIPVMHNDTTFPTIFGLFPTLREILITEEIDIVHNHQSTSVTGQECLFHARTMGLHIVFTDHSLFAYNDLACVNINKVITSFLTDADQTISVSNVGRDNLIIRAMLNPRICNVIPNGVDFTKFLPKSEKETDQDKEKRILNIVCINRQTYRKGTDLLIEIIPEICSMYDNVNFLIGGDGPKKVLLDNMIECSNLSSRVKLVGSLPHHKVRDLMVQGEIYLNTSLTEAFCIAIVEAASTGLYVISTDVGGVGEVLPDSMITLVEPEKESIIEGLKYAIENYDIISKGCRENYRRLKNTYNWHKVAHKTIKVYRKALESTDRSFITRIKKALTVGRFSALFFLSLVILDSLVLLILTVMYPKNKMKKKPNFNYEKYVNILKTI